MAVIFADAAVADLEQIGDWIARQNPPRARSFVKELREACTGIGKMPLGYPLLPGHSRLRRQVYGNYLIFYEASGRNVFIARILHGARDYDSLLFPDG